MSDPDEVNGADERPPRPSWLTLVGLLGGALLVAVLFGQLTAPDPPPRPATAIAPTTTSSTLERAQGGLPGSLQGEAQGPFH